MQLSEAQVVEELVFDGVLRAAGAASRERPLDLLLPCHKPYSAADRAPHSLRTWCSTWQALLRGQHWPMALESVVATPMILLR